MPGGNLGAFALDEFAGGGPFIMLLSPVVLLDRRELWLPFLLCEKSR